jgi:hypothetical protein
MPVHSGNKIKTWENKELNILWERRAQERVMQAPEQVHKRIIDAVEAKATRDNMGIITLELFDQYKDALFAELPG